MPYIKAEDRERLEQSGATARTSGELNYWITELILDYTCGKESYAKFNEVIGVLECAKMELYRRIIADYEDQKMKENGDVYR